MKELDNAIRSIPTDWAGFTGFTIKAKDTENNQAVHDAFKSFCKVECENNYTMGLKKLIEYYQDDYKFELMHNRLTMLEAELQSLKATPKKQESEEDIELF